MLLASIDPDAGAAPTEALPATLGRYTLGKTLGAGGMGVVVAAHDPVLDREVAIKVLRPRSPSGPRRAELLAREARAMARLSHPHVVQVFDAGVDDARLWVAMERWPGTTLRSAMHQPPAWPQARGRLLDIAAGVAAAHAAGVIHRDLKPDNVLVGTDGRVAVADFGLAAGGPSSSPTTLRETTRTEASPSTALTERSLGQVAGTPLYMAPEQHRGERVDARADVFGFCAMAYELLYGVPPFAGASVEEVFAAKLRGELQTPRWTTGPRRMRSVLRRGLAADPAARWPTMDAVHRALRGSSSPRRWVVGGLLGVGLVGVMGAARNHAAPTAACLEATALEDGWAAARGALVGPNRGSDQLGPDRQRVVRSMEHYVADWTATWRESCAATNDPAIDRMECLDPGRAALESLWEAMQEQPPPSLQEVELAVRHLPALEPCRDWTNPAGSEGTASRSARIEARARLAQAITLMHLGRYPASQQRLGEPATTDDLALNVDFVLQRARLEYTAGRYEDAQEPGRRAHEDAIAAGLDRRAAEAATLLARIAVGAGQPDQGLKWLRHAEAAAARVPRRGRLAWELPAAATMVHQGLGDLDAALAHGRKALAQHELDAGRHAWVLAGPLNDLANIHVLRRELDEARALVDRGLELCERSFGSDHPQSGVLHTTLATIEIRSGNLDAAATQLRAADRAWSGNAAHQSSRILVKLNLGTLELARERWEEGRAALTEVLEPLEQTHGETSQGYIAALTNVGIAELELGRLADARRRFERSLALREQLSTEPSTGVAEMITDLGLVDLAEDQPTRAQARFLDAIARYEAAAGPDHGSISYPLIGLADARLAQGDPEAAVAPLRRALALREAGGFSPNDIAEVRTKLAAAETTGAATP